SLSSSWYGSHLSLHSFPTRRSSDLDGHASPANVDSEVLIRNKLERRFRRRAHVLVEVDRPRCLSDEQVEIAIVVDVDESRSGVRSEEHTSELQSRENLVCRLLLEKK